MTRQELFMEIKSGNNDSYYCDDYSLVVMGDSMEKLRHIPDNSISLILTDPPYHSTKKENIINDTAFETDQAFVDWIERFAIEWKRVLKPNGSMFMFCSSAMEALLETMLNKYFNVLSHIVWTKPNEPGYDGWKGKMKKEALRKWYPQSERIIFCEQSEEGNLNRSYFGARLKEWRKLCNLTGHELTERIGAFGKVNHGGAVSNWESGRNVPSLSQYNKICEVLKERLPLFEFPKYEDIIRPFEVNSEVQFTDVWDFPSVKQYKGKHPAEKPLDMLEHCIRSTTFENDIVLDCFAGSGSTMIAALNCNRYCIGIEIDQKWCEIIKKRILSYNKLKGSVNVGYGFMKSSATKSLAQEELLLFQ